MKIWSPQKMQLIRDFNETIESSIDDIVRHNLKSPLLIFTFSDPNEVTKQFLNKLFSRRIMQEYMSKGFIKTMSINPPTDKEIEKVLYTIINKEGATNLAINKFQIEDIKQKANKDMRSAIQLLQFYTAG